MINDNSTAGERDDDANFDQAGFPLRAQRHGF